MDSDKTLCIRYNTPYLKYDVVRENIIQNREELISAGYKCNWVGDLDISNKYLNGIRAQGFKESEVMVETSLSKSGVNFTLNIFKESRSAQTHDTIMISESDKPKLEAIFDEFKSLSGIPILFKEEIRQ